MLYKVRWSERTVYKFVIEPRERSTTRTCGFKGTSGKSDDASRVTVLRLDSNGDGR